MTILLVDNDPVSMTALAGILQQKGYSVFQSSDTFQALDFAQKHPIRVLIFVPGTQNAKGPDLCRQIRSSQKDHYIYSVMVTEKNRGKDIFEDLKQGIDSYIYSPIDPDELEAVVQVGMRISSFTIPETGRKEGLNREDIGEYDIVLARIALENKWITKEQLIKAFSYQKKEKLAGKGLSLSSIFFEKQMVPEDRINDLHTAVKKHLEKKFNILALEHGFSLVPEDPADETGTEKPMFQVAVSENKLEAYISAINDSDGEITPEDVLDFLTRKNIIFGVADPEKIADILHSHSSGKKPFLIATGRAAVPGSDASIIYHFDTDHLKAGVIHPDGRIDYRERGAIPQVRINDLLAVKIPMKAGEPGRDIYNMSVPVPETHDIDLKCGEGVRLSEDGLNVHAAIDGQPNLSMGGRISVFAELVIDGDVDFNTGNIIFDGNLVVKGSILDGFTVKCGHLKANEILSATVFAMGDVIVSGGIYGADIKTEGSVKAKFITDSNVKTFGDVLVEKEVIQSKIRSSGSVVSPQGKIIASFISAKMGFEAKEVGTDVSSPCRINVGMDENVKKRIQAFNFAIDEKRKTLEILQKQYEKELKKQETGHLVSKEQKDMEQWISQNLAAIETIVKEIEAISDEKATILKWSEEEKGLPLIKVKGHIFQGTKLFGVHSSLMLQETIRNVTIKEVVLPDSNSLQMMIFDPS